MITKIYGIIAENHGSQGVQGMVALEDGTIIDTHFCSSEGFAKSDLGFSEPLRETEPFSDHQHSTKTFNERQKTKYDDMFPDGCELIWLGENHNIELKMDEWLKKQNEQSN